MKPSETKQRNLQIKELFKELCKKMKAGESIDYIAEYHYPHLQFDTIRQIVYTKIL